jgi:hypothetical protein
VVWIRTQEDKMAQGKEKTERISCSDELALVLEALIAMSDKKIKFLPALKFFV